MIVKHVVVRVKPGHLDRYLAAQRIFNEQTAIADGYLGCFCGSSTDDPQQVCLLLYWRSRQDLDRWMRTEHDRIAELARANEHYERIEVTLLEPLLEPHQREQ